MNLNKTESDYYENVLKTRIAGLPIGVSLKPAALFDKDPVSPRMCRKLYEDVTSGVITKIRKIGSRSQDGYIAV